VYPALWRFAIELRKLHPPAEKLQAAHGDGYHRKDAPRSEAEVEGEEAT
jgi:hypothetical protein